MRHDEAWTRLPDLLDDRDDADLLAHVGACTDCQRQLFLLGRVDRLLREKAAGAPVEDSRFRRGHRLAAFAAAAGVAAAALVSVVVIHQGGAHTLMFRMPSGRPVGRAVMGHADARNVSLALTAEHLPVTRERIFVLWAGDRTQEPMLVGRFMVDRSGGCRVRFNLPADRDWSRFWITLRAHSRQVVAST